MSELPSKPCEQCGVQIPPKDSNHVCEVRSPAGSTADAEVERILNITDEEIFEEVRKDGLDPEKVANEVRHVFEKALIRENKNLRDELNMLWSWLDHQHEGRTLQNRFLRDYPYMKERLEETSR